MSEKAKWEREAGIFARFLAAVPDFAGEPISHWKHNKNESPDIICTDRRGNRIGVEMTEWIHEQQTHKFSRWEKVLRGVKVPSDWTIEVCLNPFGRECEPGEREDIARQLTKVITEEVARPKVWPSGLLSFAIESSRFASSATVAARYCDVVAGHKPGSGRVLLQPGGSFSPRDAELALESVITKKVSNKSYAGVKRSLNLHGLYLVIYYDTAILRNTPNLDVDVPMVAGSVMASVSNSFDDAFVMMFPGADELKGRNVLRVPQIRE